ncbi:MAG: DUF5329 family protein [Deltaproteobacteria bacterium]|nr:DUF5329 family protein [Deltaproteobacteria bacterium]
MKKKKTRRAKALALAITVSVAALAIALAALFGPTHRANANLRGDELHKVVSLLDLLATKTDHSFVRNGQAYNVDTAVSHLKTKLRSAGDKIATCEDFINLVASKSSMSGEPYLIVTPNGENIEANKFFHDLLKQISPNA